VIRRTLLPVLAATLVLGAAAPAERTPVRAVVSSLVVRADASVAVAAQRGDVDRVRALLREGEDVNAAQGDGMTALHWAAYRGETEMVDVLVYAGANLEAKTRVADYTPLLIAARTGHGEVVEQLVEAGANAVASTTTGVTALHFAAGAGQVGSIRALVAAGADVEVRESANGQTPLVFAADRGRVDAIRVLVELGADPNVATDVVKIDKLEEEDRIDRRLRAERQAAEREMKEAQERARLAMEELTIGPRGDSAAAAAEPDDEERPETPVPVQVEEDLRGQEPADSASRRIVPDSAEAQAGEAQRPDRDVEQEDEEEEEKEEEVVLPRLSYGDYVRGIGGMSPLHHAAREGHHEAAMTLVELGADINEPAAGDLSTPMLLATINGHFDLALALMEAGADPTTANHADVTPLWAAINVRWAPKALYPQPKNHFRQQIDYMGFMERLLEAGVDPNVPVNRHIWFMSYNFDLLGVDMTGATPFWRAAYALDIPAMELLVEYGADPSTPSTKPPTGRPFDPDAEDDSGLPPVRVGGPGVYPIHAASGAGYGQDFAANSHEHVPDGWLPAVKYLVEVHGADVNARDEFGYTPVHHAAARGDNELILYLVEQGADVKLVARNGRTTVDMANGAVQRVEPFPETIELLESMGAINNNNCRSCEQ
jgi:ankyrin repeat protein